MRRRLIPLEEDEQRALFNWVEYTQGQAPDLALMFHIPNGGSRDRREAAKMKGAGVRAGVPDIFLACPRNGFSGLFIELKRRNGKPSDVSAEQSSWLVALDMKGYCTAVCFGADDAIETVKAYLGIN